MDTLLKYKCLLYSDVKKLCIVSEKNISRCPIVLFNMNLHIEDTNPPCSKGCIQIDWVKEVINKVTLNNYFIKIHPRWKGNY
jgi:hypothetical protein